MKHVIFASCGNDSIALIQWAHEQGLKDITVAYTNTGWAADYWPERVAKAAEWTRILGFDFVEIQSEGMESLVRRKKAWPRGGGGKFQFCTEALKEAPALAWLDKIDPEKDAICMIGVRREESDNRATHEEWIEESEKHGGRSCWAPLVRHREADRNSLVLKTPFEVLPHRSKECWPCVNEVKRRLKLLDDKAKGKIRVLEIEMGTNSKGNERVMFSPARHGGAVGIDAVIEDAKHGVDDLFDSAGCDGGWCGS